MKTIRVLTMAMLACAALAGSVPDSASERAPGSTFQDCRTCPLMVVVPGGSAMMGSAPQERQRLGVPANFGAREEPQHRIVVARPFAVSQTEITRGSYSRFVMETQRQDPAECAVHDASNDKWVMRGGYSWHNPGFAQTDQHPAVCVSFADANAYASWLAAKTHEPYRLLSETEWEYAARAGQDGTWDWGEDEELGCERANLISSAMVAALGSPPYWQRKLVCEDNHTYTLAVASFPPNPFGLYDMIGNAFEWVSDCSSANHEGAPTDGSARESADCTHHFLKGGAFHTPIWLARPAARGNPLPPDVHMSTIGFRIARSLQP